MMKWKSIISIALLLLLSSLNPVLAGYEVYPEIDTKDFIVYVPRTEGMLDSISYPSTFQIRFYGEYDTIVNWFWGPFEDPANYKYDILSKRYALSSSPQVIEVDEVRILLTYFVSLSVIPYASKTWWGALEEHVKVVGSVYVYGRIDKPPQNPLKISLSTYLGDRLFLEYVSEVVRNSPSSAFYNVSGVFELILEGVELAFYRLRVSELQAWIQGVRGIGDYDTQGYIALMPTGYISVDLCLDGDPGFSLEGTLRYQNMYGSSEARATLVSGTCTESVISDVIFIPGNYSGSNAMMLNFRSGVFDVMIEGETEVGGTTLTAHVPFVILSEGESDTWTVTVRMSVNSYAYGYFTPGIVWVTGTVTINDVVSPVSCQEMTVEEGDNTYDCIFVVSAPRYTDRENRGSASLKVGLRLQNTEYDDTVDAPCVIVARTSVHGIVRTIYGLLSQVSMLLIVAALFLYVISSVFSFFGFSIKLLDPSSIINILTFGVLLAVLVFGMPYFFAAFFFFLKASQITEFVQYLPDPAYLISLRPEDIISELYARYDMLLSRIKVDYVIWVKTEIEVNLMFRLIEIGVAIAALLAISLALLASMNSPVAGSLMAVLTNYSFVIIGSIIMLVPAIGMFHVVTALTEFVLVMTAVFFLLMIPVGSLFSFTTFPTLRRYSEDILGAGVFYVLTVPLFGPITYSLYMYTLQELNNYINAATSPLRPIEVFLPIVRAVVIPPIGSFMRISGFLTLSILMCVLVVLIHFYLLTRSGLMGSVGSALLRVIRR